MSMPLEQLKQSILLNENKNADKLMITCFEHWWDTSKAPLFDNVPSSVMVIKEAMREGYYAGWHTNNGDWSI